MSTSLENRVERLERLAGDATDLRKLPEVNLLDRQKEIALHFMVGCDATEYQRQAALAVLDIDDEFEMAMVEIWAAVLSQGDMPNHESYALSQLITAKAKVDQHAGYWAQSSGSDAIRAQQPGFEPPLFSWSGHAQDTPEGFARRRIMRLRLSEISNQWKDH